MHSTILWIFAVLFFSLKHCITYHDYWFIYLFIFLVFYQDLNPSPRVLDWWVNFALGCLRRPVQPLCSLLTAARGVAVTLPKQVGARRIWTNLCRQSKQSLRNKSTRGGRAHSKDSQELSLEYWFFYVLGTSFSNIQAGFQGIICQLLPSLREVRTALPLCSAVKGTGNPFKVVLPWRRNCFPWSISALGLWMMAELVPDTCLLPTPVFSTHSQNSACS